MSPRRNILAEFTDDLFNLSLKATLWMLRNPYILCVCGALFQPCQIQHLMNILDRVLQFLCRKVSLCSDVRPGRRHGEQVWKFQDTTSRTEDQRTELSKRQQLTVSCATFFQAIPYNTIESVRPRIENVLERIPARDTTKG